MLTLTSITKGEPRSRDATVESLIAQMSDGSLSAMGELYKLIEADVFAYALSKTANKEDAEDVSQDTFVQVWKNATQYKPMGKPLAWIFTIEINLIRRQQAKRKRFIPLDEEIEVANDEGAFADSLIDNEFLRQIMAALNEDEREVISLHIVSGLKHREIAKLLGKPLSTVLSKYNRAIKKLQNYVTDKEEQ